jgi:hypothetical protein
VACLLTAILRSPIKIVTLLPRMLAHIDGLGRGGLIGAGNYDTS